MEETPKLTLEDFQNITSNEELFDAITCKKIPIDKVKKRLFYEEELKKLQIELVKLQQWVKKNNKRIAIIFEGRDAAGKGGNIRRFTEHLNPRSTRLVALTKPTDVERGQWYFRRYIRKLPNPGQMVFFDRSWYNRAVVEPVMGFCTETQYQNFMLQVPEFEHMLYEDGTTLIKLWFSISKDEQLRRFNARLKTPLKRWKFSPVDKEGQRLWDQYTHYKEQMFSKTHTSYSPWIIVRANDKKVARLECIRYVLSLFDYDGKNEALTTLLPDPNIIMRYYRSSKQID
ncbi:polyphosphate kinase 2, PA0141 family [Lutibacter agarilyticus]|uniref:ADP/GDP-polyphosphate phosphotransferase n=1 Tax=Lutibacter agarilyticus TaxID=1109740 RepID=A0A238WVC2_9FLAO|nr:polyphosphate kinase 2 [Lutibacter agarilyticus]SNR50134.1 polyphosphate kinase 2, PA0141 family [Lutibacter agarilyticus]